MVKASTQNLARLGAREPHPHLSHMAASLLSPQTWGMQSVTDQALQKHVEKANLDSVFYISGLLPPSRCNTKKGKAGYLLDIPGSKYLSLMMSDRGKPV